MFEALQLVPGDMGVASVSWLGAAKALLAAFVLGQIVAWAYEKTFQGLSYSKRFSETLILAGFCSAILVMAVGRSLYAGLGLLGILSVIRFRTNLKTPRDLVFLLASVVFGVAAGVDAIAVAIVGAVGFVAITLYLHHGPLGSRARFDGVLRFRVDSSLSDDGLVSELLSRHCARSQALTIGEVAQGRLIEHTYQVKFGRDQDRDALLRALREHAQVSDARLLLQEVTLEY